MQVTVQVTVEVNPDTWYLVYGVERDKLRGDVVSYVTTHLQAMAGPEGPTEGAVTSVTVNDFWGGGR